MPPAGRRDTDQADCGEGGQGPGRRKRGTDVASRPPANPPRPLAGAAAASVLSAIPSAGVAAASGPWPWGTWAVFALAFWLAMLLRFDFALPAARRRSSGTGCPGSWRSSYRLLPLGPLRRLVGLRHLRRPDRLDPHLAGGDARASMAVNYLAGATYFTVRPRSVFILGLRLDHRVARHACGEAGGCTGSSSGRCSTSATARWALLVGTDHSHGVLAHQIQSHRRVALSHPRLPRHGRDGEVAAGPDPRAGQAGRRARNRRRRTRQPTSW